MHILIDGDGCPIVNITLQIAEKYAIPVFLFFDTAHVSKEERPGVTVITVAKGTNSVDMALLEKATKDDIIITQDYGLAALVLAKGAVCLRQDGFCYTNENIDDLLNSRYLHEKIRAAGGRTKGPKKRNAQQDAAFQQHLENIILQKQNTGKETDSTPQTGRKNL